jgi:sigma-B regulation protein RsbU (phosphoserine phosphatase)
VLPILNEYLLNNTSPEQYATIFLGLWDGVEGQLTYSNAGHPPPLVIGSDNSLNRLETGGTVIGLLDDVHWEEGKVRLRPGDLFVAYSDGVTEPENEWEEFGRERLGELVGQNRHLPLPEIGDVVVSAVTNWIGAAEQPDDILLVLARAR